MIKGIKIDKQTKELSYDIALIEEILIMILFFFVIPKGTYFYIMNIIYICIFTFIGIYFRVYKKRTISLILKNLSQKLMIISITFMILIPKGIEIKYVTAYIFIYISYIFILLLSLAFSNVIIINIIKMLIEVLFDESDDLDDFDDY